MNVLLPHFASPQSGPNAIGGQETGLEPLVAESNNQSTRSGQASSPEFSQVLRQYDATPIFLTNLQTIASASGQGNDTLQSSLSQDNPRNPELLIGSDLIENALDESHLYKLQLFQEVSDLRETALNAVSVTTSVVSSGVPVPTTALASFKGIQVPVNGLLQGRTVQATGEERNLSQVKQTSEIESQLFRKTQTSLPKGLQVAPVSQQVPPGPESKTSSLGLNQKEVLLTRPSAQLVKDIPRGFPQIERIGHEDDGLKTPILQRVVSPSAGSLNLRSNDLLPVTAAQQEGPIGFTQTRPTSPLAVKPIPGISSVLNDGSSPVVENRATLQGDLLGEPISHGKGDRAQTMVEASSKHLGVEQNGGQGLGSGMNHSSHSQSRFQEPSAFLAQGVGARGVERGPEFPMPTLQRLQMDVQISDTQRVSIDVGVQNRLVSAGLVVDHSVLRNLAAQFVPQLENQLSQVDLELQEFSAEVREEPEQQTGTLFDKSRSHNSEESRQRSEHESHLTHIPFDSQGGQGLHLVA